MKINHYVRILIPLVTLAFAGNAFAQEERAYTRAFYVDAKPGKVGEYRNFHRDVWSKINQVRADAGEHEASYLMQARVPSGSNASCDFLLLFSPKGGLGGESMSFGEALEKAGIDMSADEFWAKVRNLSDLVYSEIWYSIDSIGTSKEGNLVQIDYMDVHDTGEWITMEREIFKPVHQTRIDDGARVAWSAHRLFMPRGTDLQYNAATVNVYADWASLGNSHQRGYFRRTHGDKDLGDVGARINKARDMVRTELFEVIHKIEPSK